MGVCMYEFLSNAVIHYIEKELIKYEPAMEAFIMEQLKNVCDNVLQYIEQRLKENDLSLLINQKDNEK